MKNSTTIIVSVIIFLGILQSCNNSPSTLSNSNTNYSAISPADYKEAIKREEEAKKQFNDRQWQTAIEKFTEIINFWEREKPVAHYSNIKRERLVSLYVDRGDSHKKLNNPESAKSDYLKSLSVIENSGRLSYYDVIILRFKPRLAIARLYGEKGDYDSAIKEIDGFIKEAESLLPSYTGEYLDSTKKVRKADKYLQQELVTNYRAYYYRGLYYYYKQEYKKAAEDFEIAVMTSTIRYDPVNDREEPWQVIANTLIKATGFNPYMMIIREADPPRDMEIAGNDGLNIFRNNSNEKEMICIAGKYTIKARTIDGLQLQSERVLSNTVEQTYSRVFRPGEVFHNNFDFLAGNVYFVTADEIEVK